MPRICPTRSGRPKICYSSKQRALDAAGKSTKFSEKSIEVYRCPVCRDFHLTSMEQNKVEAPPSAAKIRRKLANYAAEIAAAQRRFEMAEQSLAAERAKAEESRKRAEADHAAELQWIERETTRLFGKK